MDEQSILELTDLLHGSDNRYKHSKGDIITRCPFAPYSVAHSSDFDRRPGFSIEINPDGRSRCHCYTCKAQGDLVYILEKLNERSEGLYSDVLTYAIENESDEVKAAVSGFNSWLNAGDQAPKLEPSVELEYKIKKWAQTIPKYLFDRGLDKKEILKWKLGYDSEKGRATFPVFDQDGWAFGVYGRALKGQQPKYLFYDYLSGDISGMFYGEQHIDLSHERIYLVEGPLDAIIASRYLPNVLGCFGTNVTEARAQKLEKIGFSVILLFDGDDAGREAMFKAGPYLVQMGVPVFRAYLEPGVDPGGATEDQIRRAVTNRIQFFG